MKTMTDEQRKLVEENLKLVPYVVWRYHRQCEDFDERMSIGYEALCRAAIAFDPAKGYTFATYAMQAIKMQLMMDHRYRTQACRDESVTCSLDDQIVCAGMNLCIADVIPAPVDLDDIVWSRMLTQMMSEFMDRLPYRMKRVLAMRASGMVQRDIADELGVTQAHISRVLKRLREQILAEISNAA